MLKQLNMAELDNHFFPIPKKDESKETIWVLNGIPLSVKSFALYYADPEWLMMMKAINYKLADL